MNERMNVLLILLLCCIYYVYKVRKYEYEMLSSCNWRTCSGSPERLKSRPSTLVARHPNQLDTMPYVYATGATETPYHTISW